MRSSLNELSTGSRKARQASPSESKLRMTLPSYIRMEHELLSKTNIPFRVIEKREEGRQVDHLPAGTSGAMRLASASSNEGTLRSLSVCTTLMNAA